MPKSFIVEYDCIRSNRIAKSEQVLVEADSHVDAWLQVESSNNENGQTVKRQSVTEIASNHPLVDKYKN